MTPQDVAAASRALAGLMRDGLPVRTALDEWGEVAPDAMRELLQALRRRLRLGEATRDALAVLGKAPVPAATEIAELLNAAVATGADAAAALEQLAARLEARTEREARARAGAAGARLSARLIAGLPLAALVLTPLAGAFVLDAVGVAVLGAGLAATGCGMWWVDRLIPRAPDADDHAARLADGIADRITAGQSLAAALAACHDARPRSGPIGRASRIVRLAGTWHVALARVDDHPLSALAPALRAADRSGRRVTPVLRRFAAARREDQDRQLEQALRRAPVLMVVPLATCSLPGFVLLGVVPFLRAVASAG